MEWLNQLCATVDASFTQAALERQTQLTKPPSALGVLETIAIRLAGLQKRHDPQAQNVHISIFVADHGVAEEGVSAFPQSVTQQMLHNFLQGGAAISILADELGATLEIIDVGVTQAVDHPNIIQQRVAAGTANCAVQAAMSTEQLAQALQVGFDAVERAYAAKADLFIGGEMGIANTTPSTALFCALLDFPPIELTGPGTGLTQAGIQYKIRVIQRILNLHRAALHQPLEALRCMGGFEIAALAGAYIRAAQRGLPTLVDGFISTAAALVATSIRPEVADWLFLTHTSAEPGHRLAITALKQRPILQLDMKLGEGSGAAVAVPLVRMACALHNRMATFTTAAVAGKLE